MKKIKSNLYNSLLVAARKSQKVRNVIYQLYHHLNLQQIETEKKVDERGKQARDIENQTVFTPEDYEYLRNHDYAALIRVARKRDKKIIQAISPDHVVLNGPFKGMKFPTIDIKESTLASKIVGSYESELHGVVEHICSTPYQEILDIGCAEGYYAVGFAKRIPEVTVHGFDIDEYSRSVCMEMSRVNGVGDRVVLHAECTPETLRTYPFKQKTLVMADCEGYELTLFDETTLENLRNCDLLIELHENAIDGVTSTILSRFAPTHHIHLISTKDKPTVHYENMDGLSQEDYKAALCDHRGEIGKVIFMEWAWLTSKYCN